MCVCVCVLGVWGGRGGDVCESEDAGEEKWESDWNLIYECVS